MNPQRSTRRKLLFLLTYLLLTAPAVAATLTVTTTADAGPGSLRDAIAAAASGDTIDVPAGTYVLTSGPLRIAAGVTVAGAGAPGHCNRSRVGAGKAGRDRHDGRSGVRNYNIGGRRCVGRRAGDVSGSHGRIER